VPADPAAPSTAAADDPGGRTARRLVATVVLAAVVPALYLLGTTHNFFDLKIYMNAMRWWSAGHPLYDYVQADRVQGELYFTYPPFTALLLRPFAGLTLGATVTIFTILTSIAIGVTTWWLVTPIADRRNLPRWFAAGMAIPLVFAAESTRETITFGQINMLLVVLILGDLLFAVPRKAWWAGVGIGLATALKLYPGIFIVYLLATRRWREAAVASVASAVATLLAAAIVPDDSWRFWTHDLWATNRVGRTDYTGNQSLFGLLSRFSVPDKPDRLLWLVLVAVVATYGLWRAARASRGGDEMAGLALTGLVGALVSPISWTHHVYWFLPAILVLADAGLPPPPGWEPVAVGHRRRVTLLVLAIVVYAVVVYGVVSFYDWGSAPQRTDSPIEFVLRNMYVLLALLLLVVLPTRHLVRKDPTSGLPMTGVPVMH
jgi:alpha-1,2-mannosyltransferase